MLFFVCDDLFSSVNANALSAAANGLELDLSVNQSEQGIVGSLAYVVTGMDVSAALSYQNAACSNDLTVCSLYTQSLGFAITAVLGRTNALFVCEEL